jgi:ATP-dependent Clp protease ATP-binding subunit ClpC
MMFERFTDRARKVMNIASAEAARRGDDVFDTVDLLVGLRRDRVGIAAHALDQNSIEVDLILGARHSVCAEPDVSLADVESRSLIEAEWLNHGYVGTEHLLLAVCCLSKSRGARLIAGLGKHPVQICWLVLEILGRSDEWGRWLAEHPDVALGHDTTTLRSIPFGARAD